MTAVGMPELLNPTLHQALQRRRLKRRSRLCFTGWVVFGAIHIALWWMTYDSSGLHLPNGLLGLAVWPLLLASTGCFVGFLSYRIRRMVSPMPGSGSGNQDDESVRSASGRSSSIAPVGA